MRRIPTGGRWLAHERPEPDTPTPPAPEPEPVSTPATAPLSECAICAALRRGIPLEAAVAMLHAVLYEE